MQRSVFERIQVPEQNYPYLLAFLRQRFGEVTRLSNTFLSPQGKLLATLLNEDTLMMKGARLFDGERIRINELVTRLRALGRPARITKIIHSCESCQAFYSWAAVRSSNEADNDIHAVRPVAEFSFYIFIRDKRSIFQSKSWIPQEKLARILRSSVDARKANILAKFRCEAFDSGTKLTIQQLLEFARSEPSLSEEGLVDKFLDEQGRERYAARPPAFDATSPVKRRRKSWYPIEVPKAGSWRPPKRHEYGWKEGTLLDWTIKVKRKILTQNQKLSVMQQLGLVVESRFEHVVANVVEDASLYDPPADEKESPEDALLRRQVNRRRKAWSNPRRYQRTSLDWRDGHGPKSIRFVPEQPSGELRVDPKEEKLSFLRTFNIQEEEIAYERNGLIKAQKVVESAQGPHSVQIFNAPFYPQLLVDECAFPPHQLELGRLVASELKGRIAMTQSKAAVLSLVVIVQEKYTVRVASRETLPVRVR